ncbi:hypothetical protein COB72_06330 [bacterium]|nr:MAG: hypothetical protein COB72_06330 [bacterium]
MIWLWILSGVLVLLGTLSVLGNLGLIIHYYIAKLRKVDPLPTGSMIPIIGGLSLSITALIIPVDLNGNRLLYAGLLLFTDPFIWMLLYLPIYLLLEKHKIEQSNDS